MRPPAAMPLGPRSRNQPLHQHLLQHPSNNSNQHQLQQHLSNHHSSHDQQGVHHECPAPGPPGPHGLETSTFGPKHRRKLRGMWSSRVGPTCHRWRLWASTHRMALQPCGRHVRPLLHYIPAPLDHHQRTSRCSATPAWWTSRSPPAGWPCGLQDVTLGCSRRRIAVTTRLYSRDSTIRSNDASTSSTTSSSR